MSPGGFCRWAVVLVLLAAALPAAAEDMRASRQEQQRRRAELLEQARRLEAQAEAEARSVLDAIAADRERLSEAIRQLETDNQALTEAIARRRDDIARLTDENTLLDKKVQAQQAMAGELVGLIRTAAKDAAALLIQSPQSALATQRAQPLTAVAEQNRFPGMGELESLRTLLMSEIHRSGEVRIQQAPFVDRAGRTATGRVLTIGNFTAIYHHGKEVGFLTYSDSVRQWFALSRLPSPADRRAIRRYLAGQRDALPIDITRGGALRQLAHRPSLLEQVQSGGPIVWPILAVLALSMLLILERLVFIARKAINVDRFMTQVADFLNRDQWDACTRFCRQHRHKPLAAVILSGLAFREAPREEMENGLQEAILRQIPPLERFLSTLGMLAAIAPLLGLLGTVTGMINTFHVITFFGTGDPKMMSGGISEALVTTMLGLAVAIPIMLCHTLLVRATENTIARLEEKSVAFMNLVYGRRAP
jgi:biopolymer transport protein ExbB